MNEQAVFAMKTEYEQFLSGLGIGVLRSLGRELGVANSTERKKADLIQEIIGVETGEITPIERNNRGAPVKDKYIDPAILERLQEIRYRYLSMEDTPVDIQPFLSQKEGIEFCDPNATRMLDRTQLAQRCGYLESIHGMHILISGENKEERTVVPTAFVEKYGLRFGDSVSCHVERRRGEFIALDILSVNNVLVGTRSLYGFYEREAIYPWDKFRFYADGTDSPILRYFDWLLPIAKGQRCIVVGKKWSGKSALLREMIKSIQKNAPETVVYAFFIEGAPEMLTEVKRYLPTDKLVFFSFGADAEDVIARVEKAHDEIKKQVLEGRDVCIFIDSISALAEAYSETGYAQGGKPLAGGIDSKTLQFIKRMVGSARCLNGGGSLSVVATIDSSPKGDNKDGGFSEILEVANSVIRLADRSYSRQYPLIMLSKSGTEQEQNMMKSEDLSFIDRVRAEYLPQLGDNAIEELILESFDKQTFFEKANELLKK